MAAGGRPYAGEVQLGEVHPAEQHEVFRAAQARSHWLAVFDALRPVLPQGMVVDLRHDQAQLRIFLHGRPDTEHLRLHRHTNEKRIGLEILLPAKLEDKAVTAICKEVRWARHEKGSLVSVPMAQLGAALATVEAVLSDLSPP